MDSFLARPAGARKEQDQQACDADDRGDTDCCRGVRLARRGAILRIVHLASRCRRRDRGPGVLPLSERQCPDSDPIIRWGRRGQDAVIARRAARGWGRRDPGRQVLLRWTARYRYRRGPTGERKQSKVRVTFWRKESIGLLGRHGFLPGVDEIGGPEKAVSPCAAGEGRVVNDEAVPRDPDDYHIVIAG